MGGGGGLENVKADHMELIPPPSILRMCNHLKDAGFQVVSDEFGLVVLWLCA